MTVGPLYLYFHVPAPVFRARVNYAAPSYPLTSIPYDNVTLGAYTDVQDGMFFTIGSTQDGDDKGRGRIQNPLTSTHIPVGRVSQGTHDGELDIDDNDYITVWDDFRIHAKIPYIDDAGVMYKDNDVMIGDNTENPPPVANTGPGFAATVDSVTGLMEVDFDGGTSFATADGATITGFSWDVDDGTITVGTATDAQITATFPAGFRWVALTVTDSNGKTHTARCPVYGRDVQNDTTIEHYEITGHSIRPEGQRLSVRILEDMPRSTYPDGCLVMFWEDEPLSASDRNHMQFIGWHQNDQVSVRATRTGNLRDTVLECVDVAGRLDTLPGFPQVINRADTPDKWTDMTNPTMDKFIHYVLHWHSTALDLADFFPSDTGDSYPFVIFQSSGESLYQQVDNEAKALVPDHRFTCNRRGQLAIVADPMLQDVADRTSTVQGTFTEEYTQEIRFNYTRPPRVHWVRGNAMLVAIDYTDVDGVDTLFTVHNIAPGTTPGQGVGELTTNEQLARSQDDLNAVTGHRYARLNSRYGLVTITPPDSANYTHIDPATMDWVNFSVTAETAAQRGLTFTNVRTQCKEINVRYSDNGTGLVRTMTFTLEIETSGLPAETVIPEGTPVPPDPWEGAIAAYEPINADSLSESYVNLANPGTYDCTVPANAPTLNNGWVFPGTFAANVYLSTGVIPASGWSMIVRVANVDGFLECAAGVTQGTGRIFAIQPRVSGPGHMYAAGGEVIVAGYVTNGVMAIAGQQGYLDGEPDGGVISGWSGSITFPIFVGALNSSGGSSNHFGGVITHLYIYDRVLTAEEVATITWRMNNPW